MVFWDGRYEWKSSCHSPRRVFNIVRRINIQILANTDTHTVISKYISDSACNSMSKCLDEHVLYVG